VHQGRWRKNQGIKRRAKCRAKDQRHRTHCYTQVETENEIIASSWGVTEGARQTNQLGNHKVKERDRAPTLKVNAQTRQPTGTAPKGRIDSTEQKKDAESGGKTTREKQQHQIQPRDAKRRHLITGREARF